MFSVSVEIVLSDFSLEAVFFDSVDASVEAATADSSETVFPKSIEAVFFDLVEDVFSDSGEFSFSDTVTGER